MRIDLRPEKLVFTGRSAAWSEIFGALCDMEDRVERFEATLALFDHVRTDGRRYWARIAAESAALTVWHFKKSLDALGRAINKDSRIRAAAKHDRLKQAKNAFRGRFPGTDGLRYLAAHSAEWGRNPSKHGIAGRGGKFGMTTTATTKGAMHEGLRGTTLFATVDGDYVSLDINAHTLQALIAIAREAASALSVGN